MSRPGIEPAGQQLDRDHVARAAPTIPLPAALIAHRPNDAGK
jgi:hypothetical protein